MNFTTEPKDIVFLIPTCTKYLDKANAIRNTWAKQLKDYGFKHLFLIGKPELQHPEIEGDVLYVPCKDDYESLLLKLVLGYEFLYQSMSFKYVYKMDDDCYPNLRKLANDILPQLNKQYIGGVIHPIGGKMDNKWHCGKCSNPKFDQPYKFDTAPFEYAYGGYGYFLHKEILPVLFELKDELKSELKRYIYSYEDVRIAEMLEKHDIFVNSLKKYSVISGANYNNSHQYLVYDIQNPRLMKLISQQRLKVEDSSVTDSYLNRYFDHIYVVNLKFKVTNRLTVAKHLKNHGVNYEIFGATNGFIGEPLEKFEEYQKQELGNLKRYPEYSEAERVRGHRYISSAGAMGYIYTYIKILEDAKKKGYKNFLILEDDILLSNNFENEFKNFIQSINKEWKILQLGASQYGWDNIDLASTEEQGFYFPKKVDTCGSFAIAFDASIIDELIEAESAFEAPFDHLPMSELYERYQKKCFVAYPNIVIPDVTESSIRGKRSQYDHSKLMKWDLKNFDYPLRKPSISIIITSKNNLKYYKSFSKNKQLPFSLRLFFNSNDGLRSLHNIELLDVAENEILPLDNQIYASESDYMVAIDEEECLTENDIVKFIEYKLAIREKNITALKEVKTYRKRIKKNRVSVIIPTYKRPKNLKRALASVGTQDYHDIEIIVVSDNGENLEFIEETRRTISSFYNQNTHCNVVLLEHTVNRNGAAARNTGIANSTGEYICFLDDDDIYLPGRLSKSIELLKTTNKEVGAVYCGFTGWNSSENDLKRYKTGDLTLDILLLDYKKHYLSTPTATYKREAILDINGFDETYRRHQDLEFNLRFFETYTVEALRECLVQLNPEPTDVNNRVYDLQMVELKQKFLNQFSYIIDSYDNNLSKSIYEAHWAEAKRFISKPNVIVNQIGQNSEEKLVHVLNHDRDIIQKQYTLLQNKYDLLSESISDLANVSIKKKPLQKLSNYKSLLKTYYKQQK